MTWTDYTDPDGKTGGKVGYSDRLSVAYALRPGKPSSEFYGFMVFSNEYSGYFPCGIEIGDSFETVMTKYNAPQKDILKLLGVDDISEWNGERINLYREKIYLSGYEKQINWDEETVKDNLVSLTYSSGKYILKFNFNRDLKLVSIEDIKLPLVEELS